ncbi:MAG: diaminopimelate epimerase [Actinomycetota bacterium]|nr:diaminopimelate epimerase [Actinomycetota bacterium]
MNVQLAKYHGLGNDFLVLVDRDGERALGPDSVAALCDRHRGIGADGVLRLGPARRGGSFAMELRNADGGLAETSGNGLRCAALAAVHAGLADAGELVVETAAGDAPVRVGPDTSSGRAEVRVDMGSVSVGGETEARALPLGPTRSGADPAVVRSALGGLVAALVDVGNPHVVIYAPRPGGPVGVSGAGVGRSVDVATVGPAIEAGAAGGVNVELASVSGAGVTMTVWERGAGLTLACGSGSCATAAALRAAGLVADRVLVSNPGGELLVELSGPLERPRAVLTGPAQRVASVQVELDDLVRPVRAGGRP